MGGGSGWRRFGRTGSEGPGGSSSWAWASTTAALLNLTGLGIGYAYLRRWLRLASYLSVMLGIVVATYWTSDTRVAPVWAVIAIVWIAASIGDGWRMATQTTETDGVATGASALSLVIALILLVAEMAGFLAYRSGGQRSLAAGLDAHRAGDCRTAIEHYENVSGSQKLTFSSVVPSARAKARECEQLVSAQRAHKESAFSNAVSRFRSFLRVHPDSVLASSTHAELAQTYSDWGTALASRGDYGGALEKYGIVRLEFGDTPAGSSVEGLFARAESAWSRAYQRRLTDIGGQIRSSLARLRRLGAVPRLARWFEAADDEFTDVRSAVEIAAPPETAAAAHALLGSTMDDFPGALSSAGLGARNGELCAAPSVLAQLASRGRGRNLLKIQRSLKEQGFRLDFSVLGSARQMNRRLPTGRYVISGTRSGSNSVTIENKLGFDAIVAFKLDRTPALSVYVRSGDEYAISGMPDGNYRVYYTLGKDWDSKYRTFTRRCAFIKGSVAGFESDASTYTIGTLTLGGAGRGKGRATLINPARFPGGPG
jgi:hypothetical protein